MIVHSKALITLKEQVQETLDFVVLNCYSVPGLKTTISKVQKSESGYFISRPDYFPDTCEIQQLKKIAQNYKKILGKHLLLSSFSYFESYVYNVIREIFDFHNGNSIYITAETKTKTFINSLSKETILKKRKLQEYPKKGKEDRYKKYIIELTKENYKFPTELMSYYGLKKLFSEIEDLKSYQIPELLHDALHLDLSPSEIESYHNIRDERNKIAHGDINSRVELKKSLEYNRFLRDWAIRIDKHIVENFFVIENI